ncbi:hypothetical protein MMC25_007011 [Agyrium rufum]|nr:hypothetical protein [Agyrium rufum]
MYAKLSQIALGVSLLLPSTTAQNILSDPGTYGPSPEIVHLYYEEWPTGIAVSKTGRKFSNYPPALDPTDQQYTVAELKSNNTEVPYPSAAMNLPPGGRINMTTVPATGANYQNYLIGVQSVVIDPADRLWILDTGRVATPNGTMVPASYGGPKLIGINLTNDTIFQTIVFGPDAAPSDSYLNDIRFDLSPTLSGSSGKGIAYVTDSSPEGRNALVVVDLGTGQAWRHLLNIPAVSATQGFVPTVWGQTIYTNGTNGQPIGNVNFGADGITLSADGTTLYFSSTGGRQLYSVPTARLRDRSAYSEILAQASVLYLGEKGLSDGFESDSAGNIYVGDIEANAIATYDAMTGIVSTFVRDPRFSWTDTMSVGADGYLYFTENQLWRGPAYQGGVERRVKPYVLFRVPCKGNGTKIQQSAP